MNSPKLFLLVFSFFFCLVSNAQTKVDSSLFTFFYQYGDSIPTIKIQTDHKLLIKKKDKEEYQPAIISFNFKDTTLSLPAEVRARGNVRKKVCYFPPLKINFKKGDLRKIGLAGKFDKLKTVLQCKSGKSGDAHTKKEHLAYELFSVISEVGIKTKLVKFEIWQDEVLEKEITGFLIEEEKEYCSRLNAKLVEANNLRIAAMERGNYLKMVFFQYLIANTDWAISNKHNIEMLALPGATLVAPIPYDFDYSGFVGTGYGVPSENLPIKKVTDRYYQGEKVTVSEAKATAQLFKDKKEALYSVVQQANYLDEKSKKSVRFYLDSFYKEIENPKVVKFKFASNR